MYLYIILLSLLLIVSFLYKQGIINKKVYFVVVLILLVSVQGSRGINVGRDTSFYETAFYDSRIISFNTMIHSFPRMFIPGHYQSVETGYLIFNKFISIFTSNPQFLLYAVSLISNIGFLKFMYDNSVDLYWSVLLLIGEGIYMNSFNMMRQMFAISLCCNAYTLFQKKHYIWSIVLIITSAQIHASSWIFIPILILYILIKKCSPNFRKYFLIVPLLMPLGIKLMGIIYPQYTGYTTGYLYEVNIGGIVLLWLVILVIAFKAWGYYKENSNYLFLLTCYITYIVLQFLSIQATGTARISYWFEVFVFLLVPMSFSVEKKGSIVSLAFKILLFMLLCGAYLSFANALLINSTIIYVE